MGALPKQDFSNRSPRVDCPLDRNGTIVRYTGPKVGNDQRGARLIDISETGMHLISRSPLRTSVGDFLSVEFTLVGSDKKIKRQGRIVRKENEFSFAIRFIGIGPNQNSELKSVIDSHVEYLTRFWQLLAIRKCFSWIVDHRHGLVAFIIGALVFGGAAAYIFMNSDEHLGHQLRSWGQDLPTQWYLDYVNHFNKD